MCAAGPDRARPVALFTLMALVSPHNADWISWKPPATLGALACPLSPLYLLHEGRQSPLCTSQRTPLALRDLHITISDRC